MTPNSLSNDALKPGLAASVRGQTSPSQAARQVLADTLEQCRLEAGLPSSAAVIEQLQQSDPDVGRLFKLTIARQVAERLAAYDHDIRAVYSYSHHAPSESDPLGVRARWLVHLIIWAQPKTAALSALIDLLDQALAREFSRLRGQSPGRRFLDAQVIDDADSAGGTGYAALLHSPHYPIQLVWQRAAPDAR